MEIRKITIKEIKEAEFNPRKIDDKSLDNLKQSIEQFGYIQPIIWNEKTGRIVSGHQRFKILKESGLEEVEVVVVSLNPAKEKAALIALNKVSGEWDYKKLNEILGELKVDEEVFKLTGFDEVEYKVLEEMGNVNNLPVQEIDELGDKETKAQLIFEFDSVQDKEKIKSLFLNNKYGWKKKEPNTNLLIKLVEEDIKKNIP